MDKDTKKVTWVYCPGYSGIDINEKADRLAGEGTSATSRIVLLAADIRQLIRNKHREAEARELLPRVSIEVGRMIERGLRGGWVAGSRRRGAVERRARQLACGTISRRTQTGGRSSGGRR